MKNALSALAGITLLLCHPAMAQIKGSLYVAAEGGISFLEGTTAHTTFLSVPVNTAVEFDPGYRLDLAVGYHVPQGAAINFRGAEAICNFAFELDTGFIFNSISVSRGQINGDYSQVPLIANAIIVFPVTERFNISLGMGLGGALGMVRITDSLTDATSTSFGFAYQGMARLSYQLTPHFSVSAFSKVLGSPGATFPDEPFHASGVEAPKMDGPLSISGGLGISYLF